MRERERERERERGGDRVMGVLLPSSSCSLVYSDSLTALQNNVKNRKKRHVCQDI